MTKEEIIDGLYRGDSRAIKEAIKVLEQQPSDDVMAIHTQGLDGGIRCAMCTNSMRSDRGCDGGCRVDEDMYKKVMETIKNHTFMQPTSDDCISRKAVIEYIEACGAELGHDLENESVREDILNMPSVTPKRKSGLHWIERFDNEDKWLECPHCHKDSDNAYAYCPNCGASFKEEKRGDSYGSN